MELIKRIAAQFGQTADRLIADLIKHAPDLVGALLLLIAGVLIAVFARRLTARLCRGIDTMLGRLARSGPTGRIRLAAPLIAAISAAVFWLVFLMFVALAAEAVGITAVGRWLSKAGSYLPVLLAAGLIVAVGVFAGEFVRRLVSAAAAAAGVSQAELLGRMAQAAIMVAALIIGLDQIEIDVTFLIIIIAVIVGGVLAGLSLAFGLGARGYVSNVIGAQEVRGRYQAGQHVRVGEIEGTVIEITATSVVIAAKTGIVHVPAARFVEQIAVLKSEDTSGD